MKNIKLSIIVPTYNSEQFIDKCINSLQKQDLDGLEFIFIDDNSTDNTVDIIQNYAQKDDRIKIIKLDENKLQGHARNVGIDIAQGEFIGFADSDDYVDDDYFSKLYETAKKYDSDIAVGGILKHKMSHVKPKVKFKKEILVKNFEDKINLCNGKNINVFYAWNKIYKSELIKTHNIKFIEGHIYEDVPFSIKALYYANSVVCVPKVNYHYIQRKGSTINSRNFKGQKSQDKVSAFSQMQIFCKENNVHLPEYLNYYAKCWYNPFIKTYFGEFHKKDLLFGIIPINREDIDYTFPVDLVYLWVDGSDEKWLAKKQYWQQQLGQNVDNQAIAKGRFIDNEELKYSLRSAEKYIPWIRKIHIVTDNQIPAWLNTNHPKINIVFHKDFIPEENLPLFNSEAIEAYLPSIPDLALRFLYGNDDTYFNKYLCKHFFFDMHGHPIIRLKNQVSKRNIQTSLYTRSILLQQEIIKQKFCKNYPYAPHHNIDAYNAQDFANCIDLFNEKWELTRSHKFRAEGDIQRVCAMYYALAVGHARLKKYSRIDRYFPLAKKLKLLLKKKIAADSIVISNKNKAPYHKLKKYNPALFCTNDGEGITDYDRARIKIFLEETFPDKSSFEK